MTTVRDPLNHVECTQNLVECSQNYVECSLNHAECPRCLHSTTSERGCVINNYMRLAADADATRMRFGCNSLRSRVARLLTRIKVFLVYFRNRICKIDKRNVNSSSSDCGCGSITRSFVYAPRYDIYSFTIQNNTSAKTFSMTFFALVFTEIGYTRRTKLCKITCGLYLPEDPQASYNCSLN
jgi:hypothetical protein